MPAIRAVAATPERVGRLRSMTTTSTRPDSTADTASGPSAAVATTSMSGSDPRRAASPSRKIGMVVDDQDADGHRRARPSGADAAVRSAPTAGSGSSADTRVRPLEVTCSRPRSSSARSRMVWRPWPVGTDPRSPNP